MYQVNETIFYGSEGVCRIADISERRFDDKTIEYFVLKPVFQNKALVYVPRDNERLRERMRHVLDTDEVQELLDEFVNFELINIPGIRERKLEYQRILQSCDYRELSRLVKTLYTHKREAEIEGKRLPMWEERVRKEAAKVLFSEFAYALKVEPTQIEDHIIDLIDP